MSETRYTGTQTGRVIGALAAKDIVEAIKNKTTLTVMLGLALMMLNVQALPLLLQLDDRPRIALYADGSADLLAALREADTVQTSIRRSPEDVMATVRDASSAMVGVILPDLGSASAESVVAQGYIAHWVRPQSAERAISAAEAALGQELGRPVTITVETVYPTTTSGGRAFMVTLGLVLAILMITGILVPYLLLEEKSAHTLELLRVAPVSASQLVAGKALAGMVYGVVAAGVLIAFNLTLVTHWPLFIATVAAGALFGVSAGLLGGMVAESEGGVQVWVSLISVFLLAPLLMHSLVSHRLPAFVDALFSWWPSSKLYELFRLAFSATPPVDRMVVDLVAVVAWALLFCALVAWRIRRWEA